MTSEDNFKNVLFNEEAREALMRGIDTLANAVKCTLGPKGRNVVIDRKKGLPRTTKDGVTVAKHIELPCVFENMGAKLMKEVSGKQNFKSGDGTTTATVLAQSILTEGLEEVSNGANPMDIKRGIDKASQWLVDELKKESKEIYLEEVSRVSTISANGEKLIGDLIGEGYSKVGREGVLTIAESKTSETSLEVLEGMEFLQGLVSPYFINDPRNVCVLDNPLVLIYDQKLSNIAPLMNLLESVVQAGRSLLIVADEIENEVLHTLVVNKEQGGFQVAAVRAVGIGQDRRDFLNDLSVLTGANLFNSDLGDTLENLTLDDLGSASRIESSKDSTIIIGGRYNEEALNNRLEGLRLEMESSNDSHERDKLRSRIGRLSGGVAVINVGGTTEIEVNERKDRVDDAIHASRAALEEGVLPGGGIAFFRLSFKYCPIEFLNMDETKGYEILMDAIRSPLYQIVENAGEDIANVSMQIDLDDPFEIGYNAQTDKIEDLLDSGVIDPTKVTRTALENAVSVAGILLTTETVVTEVPKENLFGDI